LLKKEIIFQSDLEKLIGKRPFNKPTTYEAYTKNLDNEDKKAEVEGEIPKDEKTLKPENGEEEVEKKGKPDEVEEFTKTEKTD
jgi:AFG3 family protein